MVFYRKNENWGTHSFSREPNFGKLDIDKAIKEEAQKIQKKHPNFNIDIIDVEIRNIRYGIEATYVTIFYAILKD